MHARSFSPFVAVLFCLAACAVPEEAAPSYEVATIDAGAYGIVDGWLKPFQDEGFAWGGNSGIYAESPDRIFILQRGETRLPDPVPAEFTGFVGSIGINALRGVGRTWQNVIFTVDGNGNVLDVWDQWNHLFEGGEGPGPHRIRVSPYDPERRVWVVDETSHQIFVFSNDGSDLLLTLGEKNVAAHDETHFGQPQDVAFLPDGRVLVADGLGNKRVIILDAALNYQSEFGEPGEELGQFGGVHGLAVGPDGLLFVADRDNRRVQVFRQTPDADPAYHPEFEPVAIWPGFGLTLDIIVNDDALWVSEVGPPRLIKLDFDGNRLHEWSLPTEGPGRYLEMHSFSVDSAGNLYGSDNQHARTQKFVPKADADPALLIGQPYVRR